jgi:MipA family protein
MSAAFTNQIKPLPQALAGFKLGRRHLDWRLRASTLCCRILCCRIAWFLSVLGLATVVSSAQADTQTAKPRWQLGFGAAGQYLADYRGSDESGGRLAPLPYVRYQGPRWRLDRDGVRGDLLRYGAVSLTVSADGSLIGDARNNRARDGMPELKSALEFGPAITWRLSGDSDETGWALQNALRWVRSLDQDFSPVGYVVNPRLIWRQRTDSGWRIGQSLGLIWGSERYHDHYYGVAPEYARENRPTYKADAGFSGAYYRLSLSREWATPDGHHWLLGIYWRYDHLDGAVFRNSPLIRRHDARSLGFGLGRSLWFF